MARTKSGVGVEKWGRNRYQSGLDVEGVEEKPMRGRRGNGTTESVLLMVNGVELPLFCAAGALRAQIRWDAGVKTSQTDREGYG